MQLHLFELVKCQSNCLLRRHHNKKKNFHYELVFGSSIIDDKNLKLKLNLRFIIERNKVESHLFILDGEGISSEQKKCHFENLARKLKKFFFLSHIETGLGKGCFVVVFLYWFPFFCINLCTFAHCS